MVPTFAARLARRLLFLLALLANATSTAATASAPGLSAAPSPAHPAPLAPDGTALFPDNFESGNDCRWSAAVPPEAGSCSDLVQNGCETDTDCGGRSCPGCGFGLDCLADSDCASGICYLGVCDIAYQLSVNNSGGGAVTSFPAGIKCSVAYRALRRRRRGHSHGDSRRRRRFHRLERRRFRDGPCTLTVDQTAGVGAHFGHALEVTRVGTGSVTSTPAGIACGATCSGIFEHGTDVTLAARTTNGSNTFFSGWAGDCAGARPFHDCTVAVTAARAATASFSSMTQTLLFVSSTTFATNLGSATAYDTQCNLLATAAGINNAAGTAYIAWISSSRSRRQRTSTRGGVGCKWTARRSPTPRARWSSATRSSDRSSSTKRERATVPSW